ncbi:polymerase (DNA-directed), delta 3, accessory subunit [Nesidiocoris tenuis]|uniref:DNA polymerase delta subunit 3 n=1 Tax=Nesidiocoris tenuis TaxID=355587 RepID=A0ABN7AK90_9HEMI|nr:polymerase (DNA-directed), delta 3, accessory subunit [Nesidiocoris tenuis]
MEVRIGILPELDRFLEVPGGKGSRLQYGSFCECVLTTHPARAQHAMNGKLEEYLQKIEEFLEVDDRIVTYKWISKTLRVHTNTAKQLLYAYTNSNSKPGKYLVTYVVAGERPDGEGLDFRLVNETNLARVKSKFSKISSVHVYSVQKGTILSGAEIYNADTSYKLTEDEQRFSSILPGDEIARRELKVVPRASAQSDSSAGTSKTQEKKLGPSAQPSKTTGGASSSKHEPEQSNKEEEKPAPRRTSPRKQTPKKEEKPEKKVPPPTKNGGIGALFKKQSAKKKDDPPKKEVNSKIAKELPETGGKNSESAVADSKTKSGTPKNNRKKSKDKEDFPSKQRKRIRVASESEDSNEESDADERFPSPEPEPERPTVLESDEEEDIIPATPQERGRKRVRKPIDQTFVDEDGFILTKKEYVTESCSDDEVAAPAEKKKIVEEQKAETTNKLKPETAKMASPEGRTDAKSARKSVSKDDEKPASDSNAKGPAKKAGRPAKAKPAESSSSKQSSITSFFKRK